MESSIMTVGSIAPEFDRARWYWIITLLSMDVVRPFYDLMGLRSLPADELQRVLRREIVAARKRWGTAQPGDPPFAPQAIIKVVADSLGAAASRHLAWWERNIFRDDPRDNLNLQKWTSILQTCTYEPGLWTRLGFLAPVEEEALERFRRSRKIEEYQRRQQEVDEQPLSDWDLHLYALHLFDDNLYTQQNTALPDGPRLWIKPTIRDKQRYDFWAWVLSVLPATQIDRLYEVGRQIVADEELNFAADLPHPSVLGIGS